MGSGSTSGGEGAADHLAAVHDANREAARAWQGVERLLALATEVAPLSAAGAADILEAALGQAGVLKSWLERAEHACQQAARR